MSCIHSGGSFLPRQYSRQKNAVELDHQSGDQLSMELTESVRQKFAELVTSKEEDYTSLAEAAGVTRNAIKDIVTGKTDKVSLSLVETYCQSRSVDIASFLGFPSSFDEPLMTAMIERILRRAAMEPAVSALVARACLSAYGLAKRHGVRPDNEPAVHSIAESETRGLPA